MNCNESVMFPAGKLHVSYSFPVTIRQAYDLPIRCITSQCDLLKTFWTYQFHFISLFICSFVSSLVRSFFRSFVRWFVRWFVRSFVCLFVRLFFRLFVHLFVRLFIVCFFVHSFLCVFVLLCVPSFVCWEFFSELADCFFKFFAWN